MFSPIIIIVLVLVYSIFTFISAQKAIHMFQQNRYEIGRFRQWQKQNVTQTYPLYIMVSWLIIALISLFLSQYDFKLFVIIIVLGLQTLNILNKNKYKTIIKPLVYTSRVKRQIFTYIIIYLAFIFICFRIMPDYYLLILLLFAFDIYQMHVISIVSLINFPLENLFKQRFMKKAQSKLLKNKLTTTIGITGSYGKTSSKNIINDVLSKKFYCLATPASYNTPLGISITINDSLLPIHEMFICEMGADKIGEITELFNFVKPNVGVVTSIGEQHLMTFKSLENIIHEKMQMVELMDKDGLVVLNKDEQYIREYKITSKAKQIWYGIDNQADIMASNIQYSKDGSKFDVIVEKETHHFETRLLGLHNIYNILSAIAIGRHFNVSIKDLQIAIKQLSFVPHRLELKKQNDYTIIDNAFNSNPVSSKMSLDVLSRMPNKRICITPGMIDLGVKQDYYNKEFGKYFIDRCDYVILVGRRQTKAIYEGLEESGFNMKNVQVVNKIYDAYSLLSTIKEPDCYVLLENDLPDAFNV